MKNRWISISIIVGIVMGCSRDVGGIWVRLDHPMYNRFYFQENESEPMALNLPADERTLIFDTEKMTTVQATVRGGDVIFRKSQFRIALVDYNNNGIFNEAGIDKLLLDKYGLDSSTLIYPLRPNLKVLQPYTHFRVDRQFFEIADLDEKGQSIEILPVGRSNDLNTMIFNTRLPNIKVRDRNGQIWSVVDLQEESKPLVIVLWQNRHHIWDRQVEELIVAHQQNPGLMTLIGIHIPGNFFKKVSLEGIDAWLQDRIPLYWGETEHALELNNGDQFPSIILFDTEGRWQGSGLHAVDVLPLLKQ